MNKKFENTNTIKFLKSFEGLESLDSQECNLALRCKFNFSYFDKNQENSGKITDWTLDNISDFFDKLIDYSTKSLAQLQQIGIGKNRQSLLSLYDSYPNHSKFLKPKNIPHQARWGRFRLD